MNLNDTILPVYPHLVRLYKTKWRDAQLTLIKPINLRHVNKVRVSRKSSTNGTYVFPEIEVDGKWVYFKHNDIILAGFVRILRVGGRVQLLEQEWCEWLKDWIYENNLDIEVINKLDENEDRQIVTSTPTRSRGDSTMVESLHKSGKGPNLIARLLHINKREVIRVLHNAENKPVSTAGSVPGSNQDSQQ